jgi:hypothetical protein
LHRFEETKDTWMLYKLKDNIVVIGSAARNDLEAYNFSVVFSVDGEGNIEMTYCRLGNETLLGEFPHDLIPNFTFNEDIN